MSKRMSEPSICRVCQWGRAAPVSLLIIIALHIHTVRAPPKPLRTFSTAHPQAVKLACEG